MKEQILDCKESAVLCNALCGNHGADHQAFQEINKDDAFDATVNVAMKNGMYKNSEMCRICSSKWCRISYVGGVQGLVSSFFRKNSENRAILFAKTLR